MKKFFITEIIVAVALIVVLLLFLKGPELLMPMSTDAMLALILAVLFFLFTALVYREDSNDERERIHKLQAGRIAYVAGIAVVTLGIIVQSFSHNIDPWLVYALIVMIISKIGSRMYSQLKQ